MWLTHRPGGRTNSASELLDRRVAQQQALDALGAEVDGGHGLLGRALDGDDGAQAEGVVGHPVARGEARDVAGGLGLGRRVGAEGGRAEVAAAGVGGGAEARGATAEVAAAPAGLLGGRAPPVDEVY